MKGVILLNLELQLKQTQKIVMTQELRQSLAILQMNSAELQEFVEKEAEENPTLDVEAKENTDWEKYIRDIRDNAFRKTYDETENSEYNPENFVAGKVTLYEHMEHELSFLELDETERIIAEDIVRQLDEDGYFRLPIEQYCKRSHVTFEEFEKIIRKIQMTEPIGLGARNLQEALFLQLQAKGCKDDILFQIIREDLELLANRKFCKLIKKYHISKSELSEYIDEIRSLEPRPGRNFSADEIIYIIPDVYVEIKDDKVEVTFNEYSVPTLTIPSMYQKILLQKEDEGTKDYIKKRLNRAEFVIQSIEQRKNTIIHIATEIVKYQKDFFVKSDGHIIPMLMKDIAQTTGFHESTVSRTVNGKYMMTSKGIFEFREFFSTRIDGEEGMEYSSLFAKQELKDFIETENKKFPLSDQKIVQLLEEKGIFISRRTVTKYREELGIPASSKRKELRS